MSCFCSQAVQVSSFFMVCFSLTGFADFPVDSVVTIGVAMVIPSALVARGIQISGGHTAGVTPVPIPNTEVKPRRADDTARVTVWERRSPPGLKPNGPSSANNNGERRAVLFF